MAIQQQKDHPLNIYRASAGSGKTHLLTGFYLRLLFEPRLLPDTHSGEMKFSEILAVTFTNKATAEMKGRIIDQLFLLSRDPLSSDYFSDIAPAFASGNLSDASRKQVAAAIREKATQLLVQILNEYSSFNISTIDSFFQRIVRSFARELNIPGNYEVELDADRVLEAAVTNFIDKLNRREAPDVFNWMLNYSTRRIEEGAGWDFRDSLVTFAKKILGSEAYRSHSQAIRAFTSDKKRLDAYAKMLDKMIADWRQAAVRMGSRGLDLIGQYGFQPTDFVQNGRGIVTYLENLSKGEDDQPGATFQKAANDPAKLFKRKDVAESTKDTFLQLFQQIITHTMGQPYKNYMTACAIRRNFYQLGIIAYIDQEVTDYCNEQNVMLLSSTTEMLSRLIGKDDAPFIYEKTGTRIHSYMIDEFQDTSGMQWGNFKPLLSNAIAQGYQNLIVGDVKQSIYRWRGGDWNLLNAEINDYETWAHHDDSTSLTTNWRSLPAIVEFNNDFFGDLAPKLDQLINSQRIQGIYADVAQSIAPPKQGPGKPQGYVSISFLQPVDAEGNAIAKPSVDDFIAEASRRLPLVIIELQQKGFRPSDIAILCRRNSECRWAAEAMLRYKDEHPDSPYCMDIISGEALVIAARPAIQTLIHLMAHLQSPDSDIIRAVAWCSLFQLDGCSSGEAFTRYFQLPANRRTFHPELAHRPLYEMTEELISLLPEKARQEDAPFLQAFRDLVIEFIQAKGSDLSGFLTWWEQTGAKKAVTTPDEQDAILVMTVHKSKGLGKPAVILPYASWNLDLKADSSDLLWCEPKEEPFAMTATESEAPQPDSTDSDASLPESASSDAPQFGSTQPASRNILLPIAINKKLELTIFQQDYIEERERAVIDNLNTAYVAFTRAKEALIIMTPKSDKDGGTDLKDYLRAYCQQQGNPDALTRGQLQRASFPASAPAPSPASAPASSPASAPSPAPPPASSPCQPSLADTPPSAPHLPNLTILHDPARPDITAKERGNYVHAVLQEIRTASQAPQVISDLYARGIIDPQVITEQQMQQTIARILQRPDVGPWFQPGLQVLCELTLMDPYGRQQRPDRIVITPKGTAIVIDYKTGTNHRGYRRQVSGYMSLLRQMGYNDVRGYLLFIKDENVVEVR